MNRLISALILFQIGLFSSSAQSPCDSMADSTLLNDWIGNLELTNFRLLSEIEYYEKNISDFPDTYATNMHSTFNEIDKLFNETIRISRVVAIEDSIVFNNDSYIQKVNYVDSFLRGNINNTQVTYPITHISERFAETENLSMTGLQRKLQYTMIDIQLLKQNILMMFLAGIDKCYLDCLKVNE